MSTDLNTPSLCPHLSTFDITPQDLCGLWTSSMNDHSCVKYYGEYSVFLSVCLSSHISQKPHTWTNGQTQSHRHRIYPPDCRI